MTHSNTIYTTGEHVGPMLMRAVWIPVILNTRLKNSKKASTTLSLSTRLGLEEVECSQLVQCMQ